ncbi:hypothetical protein VTK73DRAFT_5600 [Phialemonium thermophilum]|uniref:C6 transcription factor n=1 Tax=Phialemonium thermophilum TaxID=223376 RepID=A0ABR3WNF3_9PEZI
MLSPGHNQNEGRGPGDDERVQNFGFVTSTMAAAETATRATHPSPLQDDTSSPSTSWLRDEFARDPGYVAYQEELRCLMLNTAQTAAPTREATPAAPGGADAPETHAPGSVAASSSTNKTKDVQSLYRETGDVLAHPHRLQYLKNYVAKVAPWLDMFDSSGAFGIQIPILARSSPALLYAVLALSARQMERKERRKQAFDSLELYQEAIRLLTPLLQAHDEHIIPICVILCCLEMMSASASDWRKHLEGCAALFDAFGVHGFSGGLLQAVFWCYARMDVCGALISDGTQGTLVPPRRWLLPGTDERQARQLFRNTNSVDMHANYAVYLCACVCDLIARRTRFVELGEANGCDADTFSHQWECLWEDLQAWIADRPPEMLPIHVVETKHFPQILFTHWAAISSTQLYHTACILLLDEAPRSQELPSGNVASPVWHAKRICGISLTNPHEGCLNNAIQPLWVAGKLLSHRSEHALLVELIHRIEETTGWGTSWRIADLEAAWGYKVRR